MVWGQGPLGGVPEAIWLTKQNKIHTCGSHFDAAVSKCIASVIATLLSNTGGVYVTLSIVLGGGAQAPAPSIPPFYIYVYNSM